MKHGVAYNRRPSLDPLDAAWARSVRKKVWNSSTRRQQMIDLPGEEEDTPSIFRVPDNIRETYPKAYDPSVVFLGPFDRRGSHCPSMTKVMQKHKWSCVLFLVSRHGNRRRARVALDDCLAAMKKLESRARSCYAGDIAMDVSSSDEFSEMLLLDGCFVLHFLLRQMEEEETLEVVVPEIDGELTQKGRAGAQPNLGPLAADEANGDLEEEEEEEEDDDIVLLQCSQDSEVLSVGGMWSWSIIKYDLMKLENQIPFFVIQTLFDLLKTPEDANMDLVELAHQFLRAFNPHRAGPLEENISSHEIRHLLHLYHMSLRPSLHKTQRYCKHIPPSPIQPHWIPTAMELHESGVKFRPKLDADSILDVTFADGVMEIPRLTICRYSNSLFRNLIAFEQCFPVQPYVTNYALFMDCIFHGGTRDVRLLQLKGILVNRQSSDKEAASFFNYLCRQVHYGFQFNYLGRLFDDVTTYADNKWHRWRATLAREYFSNPWVITSVAAAFFVIFLTVVQSFFAVYDYFLPHN